MKSIPTIPAPTTPAPLTTATHTPGPWKLETVPTSIGICHKIGEFPSLRTTLSGKKSPQSYACVYVDTADGFEDVMLANARLMAAAPELLQALKEIVDTLSPDDFAHWIATARAAIAKAGGAK